MFETVLGGGWIYLFVFVCFPIFKVAVGVVYRISPCCLFVCLFLLLLFLFYYVDLFVLVLFLIIFALFMFCYWCCIFLILFALLVYIYIQNSSGYIHSVKSCAKFITNI